jgi:prevent-host-death family protein
MVGIVTSFTGLDLPVYFSVQLCTVITKLWRFEAMQRKGAEEARNELPDLLAAAEKGRATIITRHGRPVAALVPIGAYGAAVRQPPLLPLKGSGRGLWGGNSAKTIRKMRDEWSR